jgi:hypothetical protein
MKRISKPDVTNIEPEYWEGVLESHGLGIRQLGLQEEAQQTDDANLEAVDGE